MLPDIASNRNPIVNMLPGIASNQNPIVNMLSDNVNDQKYNVKVCRRDKAFLISTYVIIQLNPPLMYSFVS